jgi:creatinine amidohydrolase
MADRSPRAELMTATEIAAARDEASIAFVPFGPLEWHGPHLPYGTDALHAHAVSLRVAAEVGGVVLPPVFLGVDSLRPPGYGVEGLAALGFPDDERIVGMNFPAHSLRSLYVDESVFGLVARELVRGLKATGFRLVVLANGHGAPNQARTLGRVAEEETDASTTVIFQSVWLPLDTGGPGHADRLEAEVILAIEPDWVHLDALPAAEPLPYAVYGIVDSEAFEGRPTADFTVAPDSDPRSSSRGDGLRGLEAEVARLTEIVRAHV